MTATVGVAKAALLGDATARPRQPSVGVRALGRFVCRPRWIRNA